MPGSYLRDEMDGDARETPECGPVLADGVGVDARDDEALEGPEVVALDDACLPFDVERVRSAGDEWGR